MPCHAITLADVAAIDLPGKSGERWASGLNLYLLRERASFQGWRAIPSSRLRWRALPQF
jgi:hypothetical protein